MDDTQYKKNLEKYLNFLKRVLIFLRIYAYQIFQRSTYVHNLILPMSILTTWSFEKLNKYVHTYMCVIDIK